MGANGSENFKTLLLLQIAADSFQTFSKFSSQWSSQNYGWDFWNCEKNNDFLNDILMIFFSFSLTGDPMGAKTSERYSSLKQFWILSTFFWIFFSLSLYKLYNMLTSCTFYHRVHGAVPKHLLTTGIPPSRATAHYFTADVKMTHCQMNSHA